MGLVNGVLSIPHLRDVFVIFVLLMAWHFKLREMSVNHFELVNCAHLGNQRVLCMAGVNGVCLRLNLSEDWRMGFRDGQNKRAIDQGDLIRIVTPLEYKHAFALWFVPIKHIRLGPFRRRSTALDRPKP